MQSIDLNSKLDGKRRRLQKGLEYACKSALALTALLMLVFFATLGYRGIGAFTQTKIDVEVYEVQSTTKKTINSAMYNLVTDMNDRKTKKSLRQLVTPNAYSTIDIIEPGVYTLVAHTDVDMYVKGVYNKLDEVQQSVVDSLIEQGKIDEDFYSRHQDYQEEVRCMMGDALEEFS